MSLSQTGSTPDADPQPAKLAEFMGYQRWDEPDGTPRMTLFQGGRMVELQPHPETAKQAPGFYDLEHNPVPNPV